MRLFLLGLVVAVLGCGDGDRSVSPAGKATTDCSLADILAGTCGDTADPTLNVVPEGYEAPVDSTAAAAADSTLAAVTDSTAAAVGDSTLAAVGDSTLAAVGDSTLAGSQITAAGIGFEAPADSTASADAPTEEPVIVEPVVKEPVSDTDLHGAAWAGHLEVVQYLVEGQGLDVNARDDRGFTALHLAAWAGHLEVVQYLANGASMLTVV